MTTIDTPLGAVRGQAEDGHTDRCCSGFMLDTLQNAPIDALAALALPDMSDPNAFKPSLGLRATHAIELPFL